MKHTWRWFGPNDPISLADVRQSGATGVVSALHDVPTGQAWRSEDVQAHKSLIENASLEWSVVESIPVHEDIKRDAPGAEKYVEAFVASLRAVAENNIGVVCYNFMPVVDWTRTNLRAPTASGATALRFEMAEFAAFDIHILQRPGASASYSEDVQSRAKILMASLSDDDVSRIERNIIAGLPGTELHHDRASFLELLKSYDGVSADDLRQNLRRFLREVTPIADALGIKMCIHPDDPPFSLFGLPRVVSTRDDLLWVLQSANNAANGITFCTGSLGVSSQNNIPEMFREFSEHVHFLHLRNVTCDTDGSFEEVEHLGGDVNMVELIDAIGKEASRRKTEGRADSEIPMRPDHGHLLDADRANSTNPGYSYIGRLRGLAEIRGVERACAQLRAAAP